MGLRAFLKYLIRNLNRSVGRGYQFPPINIKYLYSCDAYYDLYKNKIIPYDAKAETLQGLYVDYLYRITRPSTVNLLIDTRALFRWNLSTTSQNPNLKLVEILGANRIFVDMVTNAEINGCWIPVNIITPFSDKYCHLYVDLETKTINFTSQVFVNNTVYDEILIIGPYYMY